MLGAGDLGAHGCTVNPLVAYLTMRVGDAYLLRQANY